MLTPHLFSKIVFSIQVCSLLTEYMNHLARKFPATKFVKSISTTCIPNYPDSNLPTIFVYHEGDLKHQFAGPRVFSLTTSQNGKLSYKLNFLVTTFVNILCESLSS